MHLFFLPAGERPTSSTTSSSSSSPLKTCSKALILAITAPGRARDFLGVFVVLGSAAVFSDLRVALRVERVSGFEVSGAAMTTGAGSTSLGALSSASTSMISALGAAASETTEFCAISKSLLLVEALSCA